MGRKLGLLAIALIAAVSTISSTTGAAEDGPVSRWLGTWSASPQPPSLAGPSVTGFTNQTLREIVSLHFGGDRVRVRLTNAFGAVPLEVGRAVDRDREVAARWAERSATPMVRADERRAR